MENTTYDPCYNITYPAWIYQPCYSNVREYYCYYYSYPINLCNLCKRIEELENKVKELEQKIDNSQCCKV